MNASPLWFTLVAGAGVAWNLMGCAALWMDLRLSASQLAALPPAEQALYAARPGWAVMATAVAVLAGALGCVGLLAGKRWARPLLLCSVLGVLVQDIALFVLSDGAALGGSSVVLLQGLVLLVAVGLAMLALSAHRRGWIR